MDAVHKKMNYLETFKKSDSYDLDSNQEIYVFTS